MRKFKDFDIVWYDFSCKDLMKHKRPVIIIEDSLPGVYIIIPIGASQSEYNKTNTYVITRENNTYIKVSNMQRVPMKNASFLDMAKENKVKPITHEEKCMIMTKLQSLLASSIKNQI